MTEKWVTIGHNVSRTVYAQKKKNAEVYRLIRNGEVTGQWKSLRAALDNLHREIEKEKVDYTGKAK